MKKPEDLRAMVDATKATKRDPTALELEVVYRRLQAQLEQDAAGPRFLSGWLVLGGLAAAALVALVAFGLSRAAPAHTPRLPLEIVRLEGAHPALDAGVVEALTLSTGETAQLEVGSVATVALFGPAELRHQDLLEVRRGVAAFAVEKRPAGTEFSMLAGDTQVVVHGTRFAVAVASGRLEGIRVTEGVVELRGSRFEKSLRLGAGSQWGAPPPETVTVPPDRVAPGGSHLDLESEPRGARVFLDGVEWGRTPMLVRTSVGTHVVAAQLADHEDQRVEVRTEPGRLSRVVLRLELASPPEEALEDPEPDEAPRKIDPLQAAQRALRGGRCADLAHLEERLTPRDERVLNRLAALLAECHLRAGRKQEALELYAKLADRDGNGAEAAQFETARLLGELGRHAEALEAIEAYTQRYPNGRLSTEVSFRRCEELISLARRGDARVCLEHFVEEAPRSARIPEAVFFLASIARVEHRWEDCARGSEQYLASSPAPRSEEALFQLARCRKSGALPGVQEAVKQYFERFPHGAYVEELERLRP